MSVDRRQFFGMAAAAAVLPMPVPAAPIAPRSVFQIRGGVLYLSSELIQNLRAETLAVGTLPMHRIYHDAMVTNKLVVPSAPGGPR